MAPAAGTKRKLGKPSKSKDTTREGDQPPRKRRARASVDVEDNEVEEAAPRGRKALQKRDNDEGEGENAAVQFQQLAPVIRAVPRHTIDSKWARLPESAIDRIAQLLNEIERSVPLRLHDERKRTQASTAIQMISRKLRHKLIKQPFPPSTRTLAEEDFDLEKILDSSRSLEAQLTPMLHSIELLQSEISKEERLLEAESAALEALEVNARGESSRRKKANRNLHEILQDESDDRDEEPIEKDVLAEHRSQQRLLEIAKTDEDLQPVMKELHNHLDSIQGNVEQLEGLPSAIDGSSAALQEVLLKHVGRRRYEQVLLG